jgi:hypothetical protein
VTTNLRDTRWKRDEPGRRARLPGLDGYRNRTSAAAEEWNAQVSQDVGGLRLLSCSTTTAHPAGLINHAVVCWESPPLRDNVDEQWYARPQGPHPFSDQRGFVTRERCGS